MTRWLLLASSLLLLVPAGCDDKNKDRDESDDESDEETKEEKGKAKEGKAKDEGKPKVFLDCSEAKGGGYLTSAKTAQAKSSIGAIARGAAAAYEREYASAEQPDEVSTHRLCKSATPVPAAGPPKGTKYEPKSDGTDYETGDEQTGWRCLKFAMTQPHYFQVGYNAGSGYKSTELGLPDPGPDGFEAWAMGDLDGDGRPSLYVRTGKVDKEAQRLKLSPVMSCVDPFE